MLLPLRLKRLIYELMRFQGLPRRIFALLGLHPRLFNLYVGMGRLCDQKSRLRVRDQIGPHGDVVCQPSLLVRVFLVGLIGLRVVVRRYLQAGSGGLDARSFARVFLIGGLFVLLLLLLVWALMLLGLLRLVLGELLMLLFLRLLLLLLRRDFYPFLVWPLF